LLALSGACAFDGNVNFGSDCNVNFGSAADPGASDASSSPDSSSATDDAGSASSDGAATKAALCPDDPALVLCHEYEDSLSDSSTYGNHATGTDHGFGAGVAGQALASSATTEVKVAYDASLQFGPDTMTLEAWVFPKAIPSTGRVGVVDQDGGPSIFIYANGDVQCFAGNRRVGTGPGMVAASSWVHLACTHNSGTTKIYIDGTLALEEGNGGSITAGTIGMAVGGNSPSGDPFNGLIDNLRVWTVARSATDICAAAGQTNC
jgi:hypothetical protein